MKIQLTFKTPDVLDSIDEYFAEMSDEPKDEQDEAEREEAGEQLHQLKELANKFVKWGEYVTIELDSETGIATVLPV